MIPPSSPPSIDSETIDPNEGTGRWLILRAFPLIVLALAIGALAGGLRWIVDFFPVLHGMLFGAFIGALAGSFGGRDTPRLWGASQRFWLLLNLHLSYLLAMGVTLSHLNAPPLASTLTWLRNVHRGLAGEPFFGANIWTPLQPSIGEISGGAWIFFNVLDNALFLFLALLFVGIVIGKYHDEDEGHLEEGGSETGLDSDSDFETNANDEEMDEDADSLPTHAPIARRLFFLQWGIISLAVIGMGALDDSSRDPRGFNPASIAQLRSLEGRYVFEDGAFLLGPPRKEGSFNCRIAGYDNLVCDSEPSGTYMLSLRGSSPTFSGTLYTGKTMRSVRARFSDDGETLQLAGRVQARGTRMEALVEARRD